MNSFQPLIGQPQAVELLTQVMARERIAPAYLFAGPAGVGRRLAAACFVEGIFAQADATTEHLSRLRHRIQQRNHPDLLWVEPTYLHQGKRLTATAAAAAGISRKTAPIIRLEQVRELAQFLARSPLEAPRSMVVIEGAETMAEGAANGLLKTLEEPGQATLILIAPSLESLLPTLVSRCQRIPFYRLNQTAMAAVLQSLEQTAVLNHPEVLQLAQGSPGAAIAHWEKLQTMPAELLQAITSIPHSARDALSLARQIDRNLESEMQIWLIDYLQQICWQRLCTTQCPTTPTLRPIQQLERARQLLLTYVQPRLVWEVTLLGLVGKG